MKIFILVVTLLLSSCPSDGDDRNPNEFSWHSQYPNYNQVLTTQYSS
jgi:hypothetical protein